MSKDILRLRRLIENDPRYRSSISRNCPWLMAGGGNFPFDEQVDPNQVQVENQIIGNEESSTQSSDRPGVEAHDTSQ